MLFFVKQKMAYELRISDCSSDVCSSDLRTAEPASANASANEDDSPPSADWTPTAPPAPATAAMVATEAGVPEETGTETPPDPRTSAATSERKRDRQDTDVTVSVDTGGRRIINKKKETKRIEYKSN